MKLKTTFLLLFLLITPLIDLYAQEEPKSLYDKKGRLKISPELFISKKQLKKFIKIEPYLAYRLMEKLKYPMNFRRAEVEGVTLYSFKVSPEGKVLDIKASKFNAEGESGAPEWVINESELLKQFFANENYIQSLALEKGEMGQYFLPVRYTLDYEVTFRKIENGFIHIQKKKSRIISVDSGPCRGKTKED